jgi:hypothetical protein
LIAHCRDDQRLVGRAAMHDPGQLDLPAICSQHSWPNERADLDFKQHLWHGTRTLEAEH